VEIHIQVVSTFAMKWDLDFGSRDGKVVAIV
jgi:hypothetical protein